MSTTDVVGEKRTDLAYPIRGREVTIVSALSDKIQYEFTEPWMIELELGNKWVTAGTYVKREYTNHVEGRIELTTEFDKHAQINTTNKSAGVTEMVLSLNELDNTDHLEDEKLSNVLLRHHVTGSDKFMCLEPVTPQYRNGEFASLNLRIMDLKMATA